MHVFDKASQRTPKTHKHLLSSVYTVELCERFWCLDSLGVVACGLAAIQNQNKCAFEQIEKEIHIHYQQK